MEQLRAQRLRQVLRTLEQSSGDFEFRTMRVAREVARNGVWRRNGQLIQALEPVSPVSCVCACGEEQPPAPVLPHSSIEQQPLTPDVRTKRARNGARQSPAVENRMMRAKNEAMVGLMQSEKTTAKERTARYVVRVPHDVFDCTIDVCSARRRDNLKFSRGPEHQLGFRASSTMRARSIGAEATKEKAADRSRGSRGPSKSMTLPILATGAAGYS